ncbi:hypothetical protein QOT17_000279 [Balamuthia mandrillaris]
MTSSFLSLPLEVLCHVAEFLDAPELFSLSAVCRHLRSVAEYSQKWKKATLFRFFPNNAREQRVLLSRTTTTDWQTVYKAFTTTVRWSTTNKHPELDLLSDGLAATVMATAPINDDNISEFGKDRCVEADLELCPVDEEGKLLPPQYFEVKHYCDENCFFHVLFGICNAENKTPFTEMTMWESPHCYAYAASGIFFGPSSYTEDRGDEEAQEEDEEYLLEGFEDGDTVGVLFFPLYIEDERADGCPIQQNQKASSDEKEKEAPTKELQGGSQNDFAFLRRCVSNFAFFVNGSMTSTIRQVRGKWRPCVNIYHPLQQMVIVPRPKIPNEVLPAFASPSECT